MVESHAAPSPTRQISCSASKVSSREIMNAKKGSQEAHQVPLTTAARALQSNFPNAESD